jgi:hypothetical protein
MASSELPKSSAAADGGRDRSVDQGGGHREERVEVVLPSAVGDGQVGLDRPMPSPIVFTPELLAVAAKSPRFSAPLLHKWAREAEAEPAGAGFRAQVERAAALVPSAQRKRVLGQLTAERSSDDQVRAALGSLLLAKMLSDHGWSVTFEPEEAKKTPDFKIAKDAAVHVVEVRRVEAPKLYPSTVELNRIRDALENVTTRTPVSIVGASFRGNVSLKKFTRHMTKVLSGSPTPGLQTFDHEGVYVAFDVHADFGVPMPAYFGCRYAPIFGSQRDDVRKHLNEKLSTYKTPLIVALDFVDQMDAFKEVEEVLLGREVTHVPIVFGSAARIAPYAGRAKDGLLYHRGGDGNRARSRLQAVLAFGLVRAQDDGIAIVARVFTNPAAAHPLNLREFAPIPRLVVVEEAADHRKLRYLDAHEQPFAPDAPICWRHVP